jgi:hypothetical protein
VGPACQSLSCCVSRLDWLSWEVFPVTTRVIITRSEQALSEAATPAVRVQRCCPCHRTCTSASAPSCLPIASRCRLPSTAKAVVRRRCPSAPCPRGTILHSAQCLVSADEHYSTARATSTLELHLRCASSTPAKPNFDAAGFSGELLSPPSRRHSESPVTSRAAGLLVHPALSYRPEPPHRAP